MTYDYDTGNDLRCVIRETYDKVKIAFCN